jgi:PadR family transcriptional regulator, regulatory protein PadR
MLTRAEELVLLSVWKLQKNAYSVKIREHIMGLTGKHWSFGAVYMPLERLEKQNLLQSHLADPTSERGGRSKRIYQLTEFGQEALLEIKKIQEAAWQGLSKLSLKKNS